MKKYNIIGMLLLVLGFFSGCKEDDIVFEIEQPQFELRDGYQLLEVIMPWETGENDQIYIIGEFNGGMDAVGDPRWLLQKGNGSTVKQSKWGIYINPNDMQNGKTLADGYTFYNIQSGEERSLDNQPVLHTEMPAVGQRLNVFVYFWASHFDKPQNPDDVVHDGYAVYVINNTGWTELALYAWGEAEAFGGWPGILPTGRMEINGVTYQYFDTGADNENLNLNLIFNNNANGSQLPDVNVTLNKDYYFELTADGAVEIDPDASIPHDGYTVYVYNNTGWETVTLYMWGDVNDLNGGWPGMLPTGTQVVNGVGYLYFDMGEANTGLAENLIFSNDGANQLNDFAFTINRDIYLEITTSGVTEIDPSDFTPGGDVPDVPDVPDDPAPGNTYNLYVENAAGWSSMYVYAWDGGGDSIFGPWPGQTTTETRVVDGVTYLVYEMTATNSEINLIFNNNDGVQTDNLPITVDKDYYVKVTATEGTILPYPTYKIYADNQTGWSTLYMYGWGDAGNSFFGDWPGMTPTGQETVNGVNYDVFTFEGNGMIENLIFNNNDGSQTPDFGVTLNRDYYLTITADGAQEKE